MGIASNSAKASRYLSGIVDTVRIALTPPQSAQVSHLHPIRTGDEGMLTTFSRERVSSHLPGIVDAGGIAPVPAQSAQANCCPAVKVNKEDYFGVCRIDKTKAGS